MASDVNYIALAIDNHVAMLNMLFGPAKKDQPGRPALGRDGKPLKLTPNSFDTVFGGDMPREIRQKKMH